LIPSFAKEFEKTIIEKRDKEKRIQTKIKTPLMEEDTLPINLQQIKKNIFKIPHLNEENTNILTKQITNHKSQFGTKSLIYSSQKKTLSFQNNSEQSTFLKSIEKRKSILKTIQKESSQSLNKSISKVANLSRSSMKSTLTSSYSNIKEAYEGVIPNLGRKTWTHPHEAMPSPYNNVDGFNKLISGKPKRGDSFWDNAYSSLFLVQTEKSFMARSGKEKGEKKNSKNGRSPLKT
jgi:hypothetical protein